MKAVYYKEICSYMLSASGYVFLGIFMLASGLYYTSVVLMGGSADLSNVFDGMANIVIFLVPILTMRLLAEEKRLKTEITYFSAPVQVRAVVAAKYAAAMTVMAIAIIMTLLYGFTLNCFVQQPLGEYFCMYLGFLLLCGTYISIGLLVSALTENQVIAGVVTFCILLMLNMVDLALYSVDNSSLIAKIIEAMSFSLKYDLFVSGIMDVPSCVYFITFAIACFCITVREVEKRRWGD